jgi:O-methyltransferase/aklanonic acid methyltransferase
MDPERACLINCDLFGRHADYFESKIVPLWQGVYDSLVARSKVSKGARVLDVGTGTGEVALRLASAVGPKGRVVAIDVQEEMLDIARKKSRAHGAKNLEFRQMSLEQMDLPDKSFDAVVGNYSLCCCLDYKAALAECLRVLKPGGSLTYNHGGPSDPLESQIIFTIFEGYKTTSPTRRLQDVRESDAAQAGAMEKYRDPMVTLALLRALGFKEAEATIAERRITYSSATDFVDRMLAFDWRSEMEEMSRANLKKFRSEAITALNPLSQGPGFSIADQTLYFIGKA